MYLLKKAHIMNRRVTISLFSIILLSLMLTAIPAQAEDVKISDVPQAVRQTIERELKGFKVDNVERDEDDGKIVYELRRKQRPRDTTEN